MVRRYYGYPPRLFEEHPEESDRPSFRADTLEQAVLGKLQAVMKDARKMRAIRATIRRRKKKVEVNVGRTESQFAELRTKIERATENLALAERADIPGITKLLAGWREQEMALKEKREWECGEPTTSPEAFAIIDWLDVLIEKLSDANREKLAFAIRQTIKRITLRRERRATSGDALGRGDRTAGRPRHRDADPANRRGHPEPRSVAGCDRMYPQPQRHGLRQRCSRGAGNPQGVHIAPFLGHPKAWKAVK